MINILIMFFCLSLIILRGGILKDSINPTTYIVKKGDTTLKIAKKYNVDWKYIYENNKEVIGNRSNKIHPGMILKI